MIEQEGKLVTISESFSCPTKRFTTAHELGHARLHPGVLTLHRDLPLEKAGVVRDVREAEANRFASAYLMPRLLVEEEFAKRFGAGPFLLSDATAYALCGNRADTVLGVFGNARQLSQYLAGAQHYNGLYFSSLRQHFLMSAAAMAIRLEELGLVGGTFHSKRAGAVR